MSREEFYYSRHFYPVNHVVRTLLAYTTEMFQLNSDMGFPVATEVNAGDPRSLSGLLIVDQHTWDTTYRGHLPSIVLRRGVVTFGGGIQSGDMSRVLNAGFDLATNVVEIVSVPVVFSCLARQDTEAEMLAFLVSCFLCDDKRWAKTFGLYGIQTPQISPVEIFNQQTPSFVCSVSTLVSVSRKYTAKLLPETKLQEISLYINETGIARITEKE